MCMVAVSVTRKRPSYIPFYLTGADLLLHHGLWSMNTITQIDINPVLNHVEYAEVVVAILAACILLSLGVELLQELSVCYSIVGGIGSLRSRKFS